MTPGRLTVLIVLPVAVPGFHVRFTVTPDASVVVATGALALVLVALPAAWRVTRHVVTIAHEGSHGVAALVSGRRLAGIRLHSDTSGLTLSRGRSRGPGRLRRTT